MRSTLAITLFFSFMTLAQTPPPSNLLLLTIDDTNAPTLDNVVKITNNDEYTNQPHFSEDGQTLYFTQAIVEGENQQMESMLYSLANKKVSNLTNTANRSEYSPTPMSNGHFSTIMVDEQGKQWLWEYEETGESVGRLHSAEPVGYHVWETPNTALAFILGEPHTLQRLNPDQTTDVLDNDIGPSLWAVPNTTSFSYSKTIDEQNWIMMLEQGEAKSKQWVQMPTGSSYYAWLPDGSAITADGAALLRYSASDKTWQPWLAMNEYCSRVTRMHAHSAAKHLSLAVVCEQD